MIMKKILVPVDFSDVTPYLLDTVKTIASATKAHVILLNVMPHSDVPMFASTEATMMRDVKEDYELLNLFNQQLEEAGVSATIIQPQGSALETILEESEKEAVDMIVMGSHGHGAVYNLLVGSVTSGVLKSSKRPVLVVPSPGK